MRDSSGIPRTIEIVAVVKSVRKAQQAIEDFTSRLTEEEKLSGIFFCWEYASRRSGQDKRVQ
jgi:hypothetical protein